jgi:hypothetical protein
MKTPVSFAFFILLYRWLSGIPPECVKADSFAA